MIPGLSTVKLIGLGVGALALIGLIVMILGWRSERNELREWQREVISATVDASGLKDQRGRPAKLAPKDVPQQIRFLGEALNAVRTKTAEIQAQDAAHARAVEGRQNQISQESSHDYQAKLARVRADYAERLRRARSAAGANQGGGGKPPVPSTSSSASGPNAAASEAGLPPEDALIATEQAIQLKAIQDWAKKVGVAKEP